MTRSPRAAWRSEHLGIPRVHDDVAGKMEWLAFGLPHDGEAVLVGDVSRIEGAMDITVSTARPAAEVDKVLERLENGLQDAAVLTRPDGSLFGLATTTDLRAPAGQVREVRGSC